MEVAEPWLDVEGIAAHLKVSVPTIYRWIESQKIPCHRLGKLWRFKASEVDKWLVEGGANSSSAGSSRKEDSRG